MNKPLSNQPIRVLIVEDSRTQRELLVGLLHNSPEFVVAGTASTGEEAISATLKLRPHVIAGLLQSPAIRGPSAP